MVLSEQTRCMLCGVIKNEFKNYETENINYDFFLFLYLCCAFSSVGQLPTSAT